MKTDRHPKGNFIRKKNNAPIDVISHNRTPQINECDLVNNTYQQFNDITLKSQNTLVIRSTPKKLKGKKIAIMEGLTVTRIKKLNEARERYNFENVWTSERKILYKDGSRKMKVYYS